MRSHGAARRRPTMTSTTTSTKATITPDIDARIAAWAEETSLPMALWLRQQALGLPERGLVDTMRALGRYVTHESPRDAMAYEAMCSIADSRPVEHDEQHAQEVYDAGLLH